MKKQRPNTTQRYWDDYEGSNPVKQRPNTTQRSWDNYEGKQRSNTSKGEVSRASVAEDPQQISEAEQEKRRKRLLAESGKYEDDLEEISALRRGMEALRPY